MPHPSEHRFLPSGYSDGFARAHLPPPQQWPELVLDPTTAAYPARLNAAAELLDRAVVQGGGSRPALIGQQVHWTYQDVLERANQLARVIRDEWQLPTGSRILLRGENHPELALAWLAVLKAGCIAVTTMPPACTQDGAKSMVTGALSAGLQALKPRSQHSTKVHKPISFIFMIIFRYSFENMNSMVLISNHLNIFHTASSGVDPSVPSAPHEPLRP